MQMPIQLPARTSGSEGPLRAVWRCARVAASPGVASSLASSGADVDAPPAKGSIIRASRVDQAPSSAAEDGAWTSNSPTTFGEGAIGTDAVQRTIPNSPPQPYENKPYQAHSSSPLIPLVPTSPLLPSPQSPSRAPPHLPQDLKPSVVEEAEDLHGCIRRSLRRCHRRSWPSASNTFPLARTLPPDMFCMVGAVASVCLGPAPLLQPLPPLGPAADAQVPAARRLRAVEVEVGDGGGAAVAQHAL